MGGQVKQLSSWTETAIHFSFHLFLASLPRAEEMNGKSWACNILHFISSAEQMISSWCRVATSSWASPIHPTSDIQPPETACCLDLNWWWRMPGAAEDWGHHDLHTATPPPGCKHRSLSGLLTCSWRITSFHTLSQPLHWPENHLDV